MDCGARSQSRLSLLIGCDAWKDYTLDPKYSGQKTDDEEDDPILAIIPKAMRVKTRNDKTMWYCE